MRKSSYFGEGEHPYPDDELARLKAQAQALWPKEARVLREWGLRPDADLLEVGCGPGFITEVLRAEVPSGSLTCLELEEHLIERARARVRDGVRFVHGSILDPDLPAESYDVVYARLLMQHVPKPRAALRQMRRLLRPGGQVIIADVDEALWGALHPGPPRELLEHVLGLQSELQAQRGGDRLIGRKLPGMLREAGFERIRVEAIAVSSDELGMAALAPHFDIGPRYAMLVEHDPSAKDAVEELAREMERFLASPSASAMLLIFMYAGDVTASPG